MLSHSDWPLLKHKSSTPGKNLSCRHPPAPLSSLHSKHIHTKEVLFPHFGHNVHAKICSSQVIKNYFRMQKKLFIHIRKLTMQVALFHQRQIDYKKANYFLRILPATIKSSQIQSLVPCGPLVGNFISILVFFLFNSLFQVFRSMGNRVKMGGL